MSSTFPLPLECLQLIVHHLTAQQALKSIATLLCVNKYVCAAILPILYRDPFNMEPPRLAFGSVEGNRNIVLLLKKLIDVLLRSLPSSSSTPDDESIHDGDGLVTELLRAFYFQKQEQGNVLVAVDSTETCEQRGKASIAATAATKQLLPPTLLPYSSYLTNISFEEFNSELGRLQFTLGDLLTQPDFQDYLRRTGRADRYRAGEPWEHYICGSQEESRFFARSAEREIRRDLAWALCYSNAERIQTLHLPISDIDRYLTLVPRLKVLGSVVFQIDKITSTPNHWEGVTSEEKECGIRLKEDRARHLEEMLSFVQEHQRRHRNVIQTARCANDRVFEDRCPEEYSTRLLQSLPPLVKPRVLDYRNWDQFVAHLPDTDLTFVKEICTGYAFDRVTMQEPFLPRCRSLESIYATSSNDGLFRWAVQERKDFGDAAAVHDCGAVEAASEQRSLVPLRDYDIVCSWVHSGRQASDVMYAFNKTLESIKISFCGIKATYFSRRFPDFVLGRRIDDDDDEDGHVNEGNAISSFSPSSFSSSLLNLPRLRSIFIAADFLTLRIHPALLAQSPSLVTVTLNDQLERNSLAGTIVYWEPAVLPHLTELRLTGTPAISFHPETLKSTRDLERLELRVYAFQNGPPAASTAAAAPAAAGQDEADENSSIPGGFLATPTLQRPVTWTWDWDLPKLTYLSLVAEFAYKFQFRMLDSTPNLNHLLLDLHCGTGPVLDRTIGIEELLRPRFQHPLLSLFLKRDRQLCERRRRRQVVSDKEMDDDAICQLQQQEEKEDDDLWRQDFEFLHLPKLQQLSLNGPWDVGHPRVFNAFFSKVAPQITRLWVRPNNNGHHYCQEGFTIPELIQSTIENLHELSQCLLMIPFNPELVAETGLIDDPSSDRESTGANWWRDFVMAERPVGRRLDSPARYQFLTATRRNVVTTI
ncbi:MAG: hypothetical protein JOS17DRAFT_752141 [Linnemannia elongata]|nr:MAG: hypothetical protein JOS17DRAFT_752141 [Linnemannia elongata]